MDNNSRREFLTKLGLTVGAIAVGKDIMHALPSDDFLQIKEGRVTPRGSEIPEKIDFRYAPAKWQSTYCFPDDPNKSLVGKTGELLYGHPGIGADFDFFPYIVSIGLSGRDGGKYVAQKLESPAIPIISTQLEWEDVTLQLTSFATNNKEEGRVDNLLIEFQSKGIQSVQVTPEIMIKTGKKFLSKKQDDFGVVEMEGDVRKLFMVVSRSVVETIEEGLYRYTLPAGTTSAGKPLKFFARFPQEGQQYDKVKDQTEKPGELQLETRMFWQAWKPTAGKVDWKLAPHYQDFLVASTRNILEAREIKNGKKIFQVGPTVYRGLWVIDGVSLLEAARYLGYDKEAHEGLESIWNLQNDKGAIFAGAGDAHWKDTAAAVYALVREAELSQNWDFFRELYPDAFKGIMYLKDLRDKAYGNGTANGKYGLLPQGFGDSGIGGIRSEYTNTLWTLIALRALLEVGDRFFLQKRSEVRDFYKELRGAFFASRREEMRTHPKGFSYLPMLMKDDPKWQEKDERKQPRPQAAQIYMSQAIYPGLVFSKDDALTLGHIELMKAVTKEGLPIETGWLTDEAVWPYNGAIVAQTYLYAGLSDLARKTFVAFLNHASPLYAWREEQSLLDAKTVQYIGDMPHNWASAECIRFLRHMMILEDEKNLRLFDGIGIPETDAMIPMGLTYSPTRWGRVTVTLEPVDKRNWRTKFVREDFDAATMPKLIYVELPRKLAGTFYFDKVTGTKVFHNGERVLIPGDVTAWECTWRSL